MSNTPNPRDFFPNWTPADDAACAAYDPSVQLGDGDRIAAVHFIGADGVTAVESARATWHASHWVDDKTGLLRSLEDLEK